MLLYHLLVCVLESAVVIALVQRAVRKQELLPRQVLAHHTLDEHNLAVSRELPLRGCAF